jgi:hypothetical protein
LEESARVVAAAARLEDATFALLGSWVPTIAEPAARVLTAEQALHHAWHGALWRERAPSAVGLDPETGATAASLSLDGVLRLVGALAADELVDTDERLVAVHLMLAEARSRAYAEVRAVTSPASDGPLLRALGLIVDDQERDRRAGTAVLASLASQGEIERLRAEALASWAAGDRVADGGHHRD